MSLGSNMKTLRKRNRLSQIELAEIVGVTERTIYNYENDIKIPKQNTMALIADVLGVSPELLISGDPDLDFLTREEYDILYKKVRPTRDFVLEAKSKFGNRGALEAAHLLDRTSALFAGGQLSEDAKDEFFESLTRAYFLAKKKAKEKDNE
ncbi:MAG: helix-turn-helix transcriptional regulator [Peptostreptococcaceae bacterium]|nr:helix-turn-helix transcriptional regulator [Peptostreptococcaceae bacterium]